MLIRNNFDGNQSHASSSAKPILKWAGGKRQMLTELLSSLPKSFNRYIEPMFGGGALFFALSPKNSIIADSNPELINLYRMIVEDLQGIMDIVNNWPIEEQAYYEIRALNFTQLDPLTAAARLLYLNRTCYNGLYRVNKMGQFNVPWGKYVNPVIINKSALEAARDRLHSADIHLGDYSEVILANARCGDLIFLDPPYLPISEHSDFKRYTKKQFDEADHIIMKSIVDELRQRGCYTIITNSNHPLMFELYSDFSIQVIETRRNINSRANGRKGQDLIINIPPINYNVA